MHLPDTKLIAASVFAAWLVVKNWWNKIEPILLPIIKEAEQMALDGKIDAIDRKKLVMETIDTLQKNGTIKITFLQRIFLEKIVDVIAEKLPNYTVTNTVKSVITQLPKEGGSA